jgi:hypothetical protein
MNSFCPTASSYFSHVLSVLTAPCDRPATAKYPGSGSVPDRQIRPNSKLLRQPSRLRRGTGPATMMRSISARGSGRSAARRTARGQGAPALACGRPARPQRDRGPGGVTDAGGAASCEPRLAADRRSRRRGWVAALSPAQAGGGFEDEAAGLGRWAAQAAAQVDAFYRFTRCARVPEQPRGAACRAAVGSRDRVRRARALGGARRTLGAAAPGAASMRARARRPSTRCSSPGSAPPGPARRPPPTPPPPPPPPPPGRTRCWAPP